MNTPVSFPIAKLLKEKGFDRPCCEFYYMENNPNKLEQSFNKSKKWDFNFENEYQSPCKSISAPTIAEVCMWLYEKHGIWIAVNRVVIGSDEWDYGYIISYLPKEYEFEKRRSKHLVEIQSFKEGVGSYHGAWYTPTEAYEAAIEHTLNNLI